VLGLAYAKADGGDAQRDSKLIWLGLTGMADPTREGLRNVIHSLRDAGIKVVMITGDQTPTAKAVARELDLNGEAHPLRVMDSTELEILSLEQLAEVAPSVDVFSRVSPSHKLRIVQALQRRGLVVAMTGDGINDGPALKAADIGITLGQGATQVAREVADIVLKDDNLATLVPAVREGRRIHGNIRKAVHYIAATNSSEIMVMFGAMAAGLGQAQNPRQLLWINLLSDVFPEIALVTQEADESLMDRRPVDRAQAILGRREIRRVGAEGLVMTVGALASYIYGVTRYGVGPQATTVAFYTMTATQLLHALSVSSDSGGLFSRRHQPFNPYLGWAIGGGFGTLLLSGFVPGVRDALGIVRIGAVDALVAAGSAAGCLLVNETWKAHGTGTQPQLLTAPQQAGPAEGLAFPAVVL
jgi:Ca2+-transporting ATPase